MKAAFFFSILFISALKLSAQTVPFPTPGLELGEVYFCNWADGCDYYNFSYYEQDTVIGNRASIFILLKIRSKRWLEVGN